MYHSQTTVKPTAFILNFKILLNSDNYFVQVSKHQNNCKEAYGCSGVHAPRISLSSGKIKLSVSRSGCFITGNNRRW